MTGKAVFVGHRGQPVRFPENSLEGFRFVLKSGIKYIETDIHITADGIAVLSHDENISRLTGRNISISQTDYAEFESLSAGFPEKFQNRYAHCRIASLQQFSALLSNWPDVCCFIELKRGSLKRFGYRVADLVMEQVSSVISQCVFISFDYEALLYVSRHYNRPVGWVLPEWSVENRYKAEQLSPDYLFIDTKFFSSMDTALWDGHWQWVTYTVNTVEDMRQCIEKGINLIETDRYSDLQYEAKANRVMVFNHPEAGDAN